MMRPDIFGSEAQRDFSREIVLIDVDRPAGDQAAAAIKVKRHCLTFHSGCADGEIKLEFTPAKRELRSSDVGPAHLDEALGIPGPDGKNRHRKLAPSLQDYPI